MNLRNSGFGLKVTDHVWHCPVRAAPGDRYLSDAEWGEIARRIVHAAGIAPDRDPHGCRWIAVRHADDHIHILATTVREDGRRPKLHNSGKRAQAEARAIETELGLHQVQPGDGPDGNALTVVIAALVWAAILTSRWHQARGHAQQAHAARQAVQHLQAAYDQAATDHLAALTHRQPTREITNTLVGDVRSAVPDHAKRILADPNWPALATVLADAKALGHQPRQLLQEAAARRELTTAHLPAKVLLGRIQHTSRNPAPNPAAEAARIRAATELSSGQRPTPANPAGPATLPATPATAPQRRTR